MIISQASLLFLPAKLAARGGLLRQATDGDLEFMSALYAAGRRAEMAASGWPPAVIANFLADQFRLQTLHYRNHYAAAVWLIVEIKGEPAGRLVLFDSDGETRLVDIALLPRFQRQGIGTELVKAVLARTRSAGIAKVSLHVEPHNAALRLYRRLGFAELGLHGGRMLMEWSDQAKTA